jgi:predicted nucleic acid-binding protein
MLRIYLDNCSFNRPFDDQSQIRIRIEAEATLFIQQRVVDGEIELAWSYILDFENSANPFLERVESIARWKGYATVDITETAGVLRIARIIHGLGIKSKDALHVACAMEARCGYFLTTDDSIIKKLGGFDGIQVLNPVAFAMETAWEEKG